MDDFSVFEGRTKFNHVALLAGLGQLVKKGVQLVKKRLQPVKYFFQPVKKRLQLVK